MDTTPFTDALHALLAAHGSPATVRALETGADAAPLWREIEASGFADALRAEDTGGAGLDWGAAVALLDCCGHHALPLPLGQTMAARGLLDALGHTPPAGMMVLATRHAGALPVLVEGRHADWLLLQEDGEIALYPLAGAARHAAAHPLDATLDALPEAQARMAAAVDLEALQAAVIAAQMAGAMRRVLALSVAHAGTRTQFGRCIGAFQAVQQQLALMAEQVEFAATAARLPADAGVALPDPLRAAAARAAVGSVCASVAATAHAVHGAIGITEAFDLQLWTRRLQAWRVAGGSEAYWQARIGRALLDDAGSGVPDFVLARLVPR